MRTRLPAALYVATAVAEVAAEGASWRPGILLAKPLLMPLLAAWAALSAAGRAPRRDLATMLAALALSWVGDVALLAGSFEVGLGAFLATHLTYVAAFRRARSAASGAGAKFAPAAALGVVVAGAAALALLWPHLGEQRLAVTLYVAAIVAMVAAAAMRCGRTTPESATLMLGGAVLFLLSDSIIAIDRFVQPVAAGGVIIMATYTSAQLAIQAGWLVHWLHPPCRSRTTSPTPFPGSSS